MVGISGASERRWALTKPRILTFLSRQSGNATLMLSMPKGMSPARMPVICVVPPRYHAEMGAGHHVEQAHIDLRGWRADPDLESAWLRLLLLDQLAYRI